ncbi:hypothetical protein [Vibrio jasicida]|uniref:hypothetical protein n=1 Tax=Vibrio jasicida TaxID=766224 RepID=UPI0005EEBBE3|nr:hypothetical protein [Vibrio jasicida]
MDTSDYIAVGALIVAIFSAVVAFFSYHVASDALKISEQQHKERYKMVEPYFMEAYKWYKEEDIYVSFALRFTNKATIANSIVNIELHLEYFDKSHVFGKAKIEPCFNVNPLGINDNKKTLALPLTLSEKSSDSGWVTFKLPGIFKNNLNVDLYKIHATTTNGEVVSIDTHIINTVQNEK